MSISPPSTRAVTFEDDDANYRRLMSVLEPRALEANVTVERYPGDAAWDPAKNSGDLVREVRSFLENPHRARLAVLDWDLSKYRRPVSSGLVREQCEDLGVPVCIYRTFDGDVGRAKHLQRWQDREIAVDSTKPPEDIGRLCASCLDGFLVIDRAFTGAPLADAVKAILGVPSAAEVQLDQYAWGSPDLLRAAERKDKLFWVSELGYWIYNRLLQFPGVLVNPVAAASYLGIHEDDFTQRAECRAPFESARYIGPFNETGPYWWTAGLEEIRASCTEEADETLVSGHEVLRRRGVGARVGQCVRGHDGAGFYCVILGKAVCETHSQQPTGWLPIGADLCRIEKARYDELSAWLAL